MSKKGIIILIVSFVVVIILTVGITLLLVNKDKDDDKEDTIVNYKTEVKKLCKKVDKDGNYNTEELMKLDSKMEDIENEKDYKRFLSSLKGLSYCYDYSCFMFEKKDPSTVHTYNCNDGEYEKESLETRIKSNIILSTACSNVDSRGNFDYDVDDYSLVCENFVCSVKIQGKTYTRDCRG